MCLEQKTNFVLSGMDKREHTGIILTHLQKVFNSLDHEILLIKVSCLGFKTSVIKWFESYLTSRKFFVSMDDTFPEAGASNWGAPLGSYLRPFLFWYIIIIFDNSYQKYGSYFYVDDISISYQKKALEKLKMF